MVDVAEVHSTDSSHTIASQRRKKATCKEPGSSAKILTATLDPGEIPFHCELHPYMIGSSCNILCFIDWVFPHVLAATSSNFQIKLYETAPVLLSLSKEVTPSHHLICLCLS
jgi:hypothetical protein